MLECNVEMLLKNIQSASHAVQLEKARKAGVTSIKLFNPILRSEANKLNFIIEIDEKANFSLFDKVRIKRELKEYFGIDVNIIIEGEINNEKKPLVIGELINLDSPDMHDFLDNKIIPFARAIKKELEELAPQQNLWVQGGSKSSPSW